MTKRQNRLDAEHIPIEDGAGAEEIPTEARIGRPFGESRLSLVDTEALEFLKNSLRMFWKAIEEYKTLYDPRNLGLLKKVAADFFGWHQRLCWDYFILSVVRLLDKDSGTLSMVNFHKHNRTVLSSEEAHRVDELVKDLYQEKRAFEKARGSFVAHRSAGAIAMKTKIPLAVETVESLWLKMEAALKVYDPSGAYRVSVTTGARALLRNLTKLNPSV